jgi:hypothetical protein
MELIAYFMIIMALLAIIFSVAAHLFVSLYLEPQFINESKDDDIESPFASWASRILEYFGSFFNGAHRASRPSYAVFNQIHLNELRAIDDISCNGISFIPTHSYILSKFIIHDLIRSVLNN